MKNNRTFLEKLLNGAEVEWKTLNEIFHLKNGYTPSKGVKEYWENGSIPWFRMEDIRENGRVLNTALQKVSESAVKGGKLFPANSIIIATSATIGEHALITIPFLANQRFTVLSLKPEYIDKFNIYFLYHYCFTLDDWCQKNTTMSSFASVDMNGFRKFLIPIPPLSVQTEIVKILDALTALTSELILRQKQYEYYREKLLSEEELGKVGFEWKTIDEISKKISSGGTPTTSNNGYYDNGTIPWLRTQEVDFKEIWDTNIKITEDGLNNSSAKWIPANCVIVAMYGATVGKTAINKIPLTTNQACANIEINDKLACYRYIFHYLTSKYEYIKSLGSGSQTNINAQIIKKLKVPVPPIEEQQRIVSILDKFETLTNSITDGLPLAIEQSQKRYEYYRELLLSF